MKNKKFKKIDLRPNKQKILLSLLSTFVISAAYMIVQTSLGSTTTPQFLSPQEFHWIYIMPVVAFIISYFFVCWLICRVGELDPIKFTK